MLFPVADSESSLSDNNCPEFVLSFHCPTHAVALFLSSPWELPLEHPIVRTFEYGDPAMVKYSIPEAI